MAILALKLTQLLSSCHIDEFMLYFLEDYLVNVLDDLGLQSSENLKSLSSLLRATQEEFSDTAENTPQRLASAVASMRGLSLH